MLQAVPFTTADTNLLKAALGVCHWSAASVLAMVTSSVLLRYSLEHAMSIQGMMELSEVEEEEEMVTLVVNTHSVLAWLLHQVSRSLSQVTRGKKRSNSSLLQQMDWSVVPGCLAKWICEAGRTCLLKISDTNEVVFIW